MKVLVTGSDGFIGRHVMAYARKVGHEVEGSTLDLSCSLKASGWKADALIHCAGIVGGIAMNMERPADLMDGNLRFLMNALSLSYQSGIKRFVNLGSTCAYPEMKLIDKAYLPLSPDSLWNGRPEESNAPYGIAKRTGMELVDAYRKQYGMIGNNLILANVYGPGVRGGFNAHVVPSLIERFLDSIERGIDSVSVWGSGEAEREFLFVEDAARAIVDFGLKEDVTKPVNIGSGEVIKIGDLVRLIAELTGFNGSIVYDKTKPDSHTSRLLMSGFYSETTLSDGLKKTIDWIKNERCASRATATAGV